MVDHIGAPTFRVWLGDTGLGHGAGTWGGFRGLAAWSSAISFCARRCWSASENLLTRRGAIMKNWQRSISWSTFSRSQQHLSSPGRLRGAEHFISLWGVETCRDVRIVLWPEPSIIKYKRDQHVNSFASLFSQKYLSVCLSVYLSVCLNVLTPLFCKLYTCVCAWISPRMQVGM